MGDLRFACRPSLSRPIAAALLALAAHAAPAGAALLVYEPFDYPGGTVLHGVPAGGVNLAGNYVGGSVEFLRLVAASPGLDYGNLAGGPDVAGSRLSQTVGTGSSTATVSVGEPVAVAPGATIYWSALFTLDDSSNANRFAQITFTDTLNGDEIGFGEPAVGSGAIRLSATTAALGGLVADSEDDAFVDGHTLLLIGRYINGDAPGSDSLDLVVYDTGTAAALPAGFDPLDPNASRAFSISGVDIDLAAIRQITFTIRGDANNFIDELRIGDSYASVVPEPAGATLLFAGLVGLALRGRRRLV